MLPVRGTSYVTCSRYFMICYLFEVLHDVTCSRYFICYLFEVLHDVTCSRYFICYLFEVLHDVTCSRYFICYLFEVLVAVDELPLVRVLQLVGLHVLPEGVDDDGAGLGVDAKETRQTCV